MMPLSARRRAGFTLVELLVYMSIVAVLGALAVMLLPSAANSDVTLKATAEAQGTYRIAQAMAGSARLPRGVRLITQPGTFVATEMQLLEAPPVMVPDDRVLVLRATDPTGANWPRVEFIYELAGPPRPATSDPLQGTVIRRHCRIFRLTAFQASQVADGATLVLPVLGAWSRINDSPSDPDINKRIRRLNNPPAPGDPLIDLEVPLEVYPDASLGAGTTYRTYHFGIYGPPVPLIGEPLIPLPKDIGIDLQISQPPLLNAGRPYDIMFAPSGQTMPTANVAANTQVFLWVRNVTKVTNPASATRPRSLARGDFTGPTALAEWASGFRRAGEMQIIGIRNGYVGTAPVLWPDDTGAYPTGQGPFSLARSKLD